MGNLKERLQKLACERKERSRNILNRAPSEIDKASTTVQTSSASLSSSQGNHVNPAKMMAVSTGGQLQSSNNEPALAGKKTLKTWRSESEINPPVKQPKISRAPSVQPVAERRRNQPEQSKPTRERTNSSSSSISLSAGKDCVQVKGNSYQLLNLVGKGGSSVVYQAFSLYHKRCVALKIVNLVHADDAIRQAYQNEVQLLDQLQGSPYVIRMFDYEVQKHKMFVVMECGDIDLASFMAKKAEQIDDKFVKYHWQEMLKCVQVIHENNIVHSDLKPANFLFVGASLKLIDFGIASNIPSNKTSIVKDIQVGTLNYISPESISGSYTDGKGHQIYKIPLKSDVWSLGCILYAMVYGRTPFQHITNQMAKMHAITSDQHIIEFPKNGRVRDRLLVDVLKKCLVRDVKARASIDQLLRHPYLHDAASLATPSPARPEAAAKPAQQQGGLRVIK